MQSKKKVTPKVKFQPKRTVGVILFVICIIVTLGALLLPLASRASSYTLKPGDVASQDIKAPFSISYQSTYRTEQAQIKAEIAIRDVYIIDSNIVNQQSIALQQFLNSISSILSDDSVENTITKKRTDLLALPDTLIDTDLADALIGLSPTVWDQVKFEALNSFGQAMTIPIHESNLQDIRSSLSGGYSAGIENKWIVVALSTPFVVVNSQYSEEQTVAARQAARDAVQPIYVQYKAGQMIVADGNPITPEIWEALQEFGLIQTEKRWQDLVAVFSVVTLSSLLVFLYLHYRHIDLTKNIRALIVVTTTYILFLITAKIFIPNHTIVPYIFPLPAFGLLVSTLYNFEIGTVLSLILSVLVGINTQNSSETILFYILASICGILIIGKGRRIIQFFFSGIAIGIVGTLLLVTFRLPNPLADWQGLVTLVAAAFLCGLISASLTLIFQLLFALILGLPVPLRLLDLSRSDHPLLKRLLEFAPGTYQHSLMVSNLSEQAADLIGADSLLTRVGAMYHDVGKLANPSYYIENQIGTKSNPHDKLSPEKSAAIIMMHVPEGLKLARQNHLPPRLRDFISEHHGTMITRFQYARALDEHNNDPEKVDISKFRYAGPTPKSRETAILMLADIVEARTRAELPANSEELEELVRQSINYCVKEDQLIDTPLTFSDIEQISEIFSKILKNIYHPRIQYPEIDNEEPSDKKEMDYS
jgi:putative nucleotidyltransferase with HDIG domain